MPHPRSDRVQPHPQYREVVFASAPVAYWRLGERSGTAARDEMGLYHGTYTGSPTLGAAGALASDGDTASTLNGTTQYVTGSAPDLGTRFSIAAWFRRATSARNEKIISFGSTKAQLGTTTDTDNYIRFFQENVGTVVRSAQEITDTNWHHAVAIYDEAINVRDLYVDIVPTNVATVARTMSTGAGAYNIGRQISASTLYWSGTLDEVSLWTRVLTPAEVRALYDVGRGA